MSRRLRDRAALEDFHRRSAPQPLRRGVAHLARLTFGDGRAQRTVAPGVAANGVPCNQLKHEVRSAAGQRIHARAQRRAEVAFHHIGIRLEPGVDLAAVAA